MKKTTGENRRIDSLELGTAYLEYCVKQGWLVKIGEGDAMQYELTPEGEKKLANAPLNFDLSKMTSKGDQTKRKRRRRRT
ncbi:MAG: hypothetical protein V3W18_03765 [candidate division Zixibacteria bacterium]